MNERLDSRWAYEQWHRDLEIATQIATPWHRMITTHLDGQRDLAGRSLLEIGCGRGDFACWLGLQPHRPRSITAADFSTTAVAKGHGFASLRALGSIRWEVADIQELPHRDGTFDTVISCETIEHLPSPGRAVEELARVLKPGGRLFLSTPNYLNAAGLYRGYLRLMGRRFSEGGQPVNRFMTLPWTRALVRRAGLSILATDGTGHPLPFLPGRPALELSFLERARWWTRWLAVQALVVAEKPRR